ncbi:hypothetical protein PPL_11955 [Heterostelium album PN500]|uniref:COI1 F-box domain-containing protein n=1 Tax=Heterostelium pallidum (strain ATCC 26659 / Pp 5 / PN500) TaxID=670386 RepID=D3BUY3_HETP5|nr:hypothetical protein PPL_11955 [Heterostelium album PN500]EFA74921.1 hypothetical protein PPL_11955 [Heterostelium album PN500]|eukprot:XP_020427055.1 hypothetical protein PPL_11955 [Heterostelium album PN500]
MESCSNQIDIFVNLSHLILNKIISYLDENIDRICFSLVCKRWFNDRDKYLIFNTDNININSINNRDITHNHKHFNLPSYNNIFNKSIQSKTDCSLYIGLNNFVKEYDIYFDKYTDLNSIPSYISTITLSNEISDQEYLYQLLLESQSVTTLNGCHTLKYGLPKTIKTLTLNYLFNELLVKGSLPPSLEEVTFRHSFKQEIQAGVLPEGLLEFYLYSSEYQFEFQPGVFPSSLKTLNLCFYKKPLKVGVLPENLECLYYSGASTPLEEGVLPKSLKKLIDAPPKWLQTISSLPNLEILHFYEKNTDISTINLDLLPSSLKVLEFKRYRLIGTMPTSITTLYLDKYTDLKSIPSYISTISLSIEGTDIEYFYQLLLESQSVTTFFKFNELIDKGSLPPSLEEVTFFNSFNKEIQAGVLPEGLLELSLNSTNYQFEFQPGVFPSSLKTLNLCFYRNPLKVGVLPENLEFLQYSGVRTSLEDGVLPKSLKELLCVPIRWLQAISSLPKLEILHFYEMNQEISTINLDLLPSSLKVLELQKQSRLIGTMPTSIKSLNLGKCEFQFEEIFPETLQYHFESLQYSRDTFFPIPSNIKTNKLIINGISNHDNNSLTPPSGITSISLEMSLKHKDACLRIDGNDQTTLKKLRLPYFNVRPRAFIPNTIEELDIGDNSLNDSLDLIKSIDSIKTLQFSKLPKTEIISPETFKTIKKINNIIYKDDNNNIVYRNDLLITQPYQFKRFSINLLNFLLKKSVYNGYLDENIDRICFSLVCKRWFNDRDKYLIFNTDNICINASLNNSDIQLNHKHFQLPSYNKIYLKSIQSKTDCSLYIGPGNGQTMFRYDFYYDNIRNLNSIPSNISMVSLVSRARFLDSDLEYLHRLLNESQSVTTLNGCHTLKYGLPNTIKSLSFHRQYNEKLVQGSFPSSLKSLEIVDFGYYFYQEIQPGVFPEGLLELAIDHSSYQHEFQPGVFPSSLKTLHLTNYHIPIKAGLLPTNLEFLKYTGKSTTKLEELLPKSLKSLYITVPTPSLKGLSVLPNLQTLLVHQYRNQISSLDLNELPPTIRELEIKRFRLTGTIPTSIFRLSLCECEFQFHEIFPETLQYHMESFKLTGANTIGIPSNLKIMKFKVYCSSYEPIISLPSQIESIYLGGQLNNEKEHLLDCSGGGSGGDGNRGVGGTSDKPLLRELRLPSFINVKPNFKLPNTVELLDLGLNDLEDALPMVPSTLDDSFYLIYGENQLTNLIIAKVFHQSKLTKILGKSFK